MTKPHSLFYIDYFYVLKHVFNITSSSYSKDYLIINITGSCNAQYVSDADCFSKSVAKSLMKMYKMLKVILSTTVFLTPFNQHLK